MSCKNFTEWLILSGKGKATAQSINSRINRIREEYSIEYEYKKDRCEALLADFNYSTEDCRNGLLPKVTTVIRGDYITGLRSLRAALVLYVEYLDSVAIGTKNNTAASHCVFEGDFGQFIRFTGPTWRNKVQVLTKTLKKKVSVCECCKRAKELHAAHRHGFERLDVIKQILDAYFKVGNDYYRVDLVDFENKFVDVHKNNKDSFYFLCQDCHRVYDGDDSTESDKIAATVLINRGCN